VKQKFDLSGMRVGVLGMAFKGDCDDPRESLSYKLKKILEYEAAEVLCTDVYIEDPAFFPLEEVVRRSDLLVIGTPHKEYRTLALPEGMPVVDVWNMFGKGAFPS
jgi:UDP-N-acetyl-D-mannosaminuronic acid dehydrogenase